MESARGNIAFIIKCCCDTPKYDLCHIPFISNTCRYDLCYKPEEPKYMRNPRCVLKSSIMREVLELFWQFNCIWQALCYDEIIAYCAEIK